VFIPKKKWETGKREKKEWERGALPMVEGNVPFFWGLFNRTSKERKHKP
jgi:hypothetical protein